MATFKYFIFWRFTSFVTVNGLQDKLVYLDGKWLSEYTICIASLPKKWKEKLTYNNLCLFGRFKEKIFKKEDLSLAETALTSCSSVKQICNELLELHVEISRAELFWSEKVEIDVNHSWMTT